MSLRTPLSTCVLWWSLGIPAHTAQLAPWPGLSVLLYSVPAPPAIQLDSQLLDGPVTEVHEIRSKIKHLKKKQKTLGLPVKMAEQAFHNHITINLNVVVAQQLNFDAGT